MSTPVRYINTKRLSVITEHVCTKFGEAIDDMSDDSFTEKLEFTKGARSEEDEQRSSAASRQSGGKKKFKTTPKTSKQEAPQPTNTDGKQVTAGMATPNLIQQQT